jgi:Protein of unknown function (DUF3048) N-terminal domain/Protein of unknown function (DUF3048) C-terminal domain
VAVGVVVVAVVAGCGSSHKATLATTTTTTLLPTTTARTITTVATTVAPTTTVTPPPPVYPLTGLAAPSVAATRHPALVVKIDNVTGALPQTGLSNADLVYEEMVEGGVTRLAAVFQEGGAPVLGPVRSGRTTDIAIVSDLNFPLFGFSGANPIFLTEIRAAPIVDVDAERESSAQYWRTGPHFAPHNLYTSTAQLYALDPHAVNTPPALFSFRKLGSPATGTGAVATTHAALQFPQASITWDWSAKARVWLRGQNGAADVDSTGAQLAASNVIIQQVPYTTDGYATGEGLPPAPIPRGQLVGGGTAWVLTGGKMISAQWSRPAIGDVTTYTDAAGHHVLLEPGTTWVELLPTGSSPTFTS